MDFLAGNIIREDWRAHEDLTSRAKGGIVIYFVAWLVLSFWGELLSSAPLFFYTNTGIFLAIAALRLLHYRLLKSDSRFNTLKMYYWLVAMILISALHWGLVTAILVYGYEHAALHYPLIIILSAVAMGGTAVLSICRVIGFLYPFLVYGPFFILGLFTASEESLMLNLLALVSTLYIMAASRVSHHDYWAAISNQETAEKNALKMKQLSITDQLTQLNNRMHFESEFRKEWQRSSRNSEIISVFMIDLDHFKKINDTHGHVAGDECLIKVSTVLQAHFKRTTDVVARYGGEEFVVMIYGAELDAIQKLALNLNHAIAALEISWKDKIISLSCSIGVASIRPSISTNREALLIAADKELYRAKANGRNQFSISSASLKAFKAA